MALCSAVAPFAEMLSTAARTLAWSDVRGCNTRTPSLKLTIAARSPGRMVLMKPLAARRTTGILSRMLVLPSMSRIRSSGTSVAAKNSTCCWTPSSNTSKSSRVRPLAYPCSGLVTMTLRATRLVLLLNTGRRTSCATAVLPSIRPATATPTPATRTLRIPASPSATCAAVTRRGSARRMPGWRSEGCGAEMLGVSRAELVEGVRVRQSAEMFERVGGRHAANAAGSLPVEPQTHALEQTAAIRVANARGIRFAHGRHGRHVRVAARRENRRPLFALRHDERFGAGDDIGFGQAGLLPDQLELVVVADEQDRKS